MSEKKDVWDKFDVLFKSLVLGAIPIVIGIAANHVAESIQRGQLIQSMVDSLSKGDTRRDIALIALDEAIPPHKKCEVFGIWSCKNDVESDPVVKIAEVLMDSSMKGVLSTNQPPEELDRQIKVAAKIIRGERRGSEQYFQKEFAVPISSYLQSAPKRGGTSNSQGNSQSRQEVETQSSISQLVAAIQPSPEKPKIASLAGVRLVYIQYEHNRQLAEQIQNDLRAQLISVPGIEQVQGIRQNDVRYSNPTEMQSAEALQAHLQTNHSIQFSKPIDLSSNGYRVAPGQFEIWIK